MGSEEVHVEGIKGFGHKSTHAKPARVFPSRHLEWNQHNTINPIERTCYRQHSYGFYI
jgi:hypothetical protein